VVTAATVVSADGTRIGYQRLGTGTPPRAPSLIVVGGAMRTAQEYLPLARQLAQACTVYVVDRRGRGDSGPQGAEYGIEKECEDLLAIQAATGATAAFGHSFGGLVVLETAKRSDVFTRITVYEPGVSIAGSIPVGWMPRYRQLLEQGDERGAFAHFVRGSGHAPGPTALMPLWYLRAILRVVIRSRQWARMRPLLSANLAEHQQVLALDSTLGSYAAITAPTLLLAGAKSPAFTSTALLAALNAAIPNSSTRILDGLDHNAPDEKNPRLVAQAVLQFLQLETADGGRP
jgi:pimeloyl-ACP methyl ester carboxylesterase